MTSKGIIYGVIVKNEISDTASVSYCSISYNDSEIEILEFGKIDVSELRKKIGKGKVSVLILSPATMSFTGESEKIEESVKNYIPGLDTDTFYLEKVENQISLLDQASFRVVEHLNNNKIQVDEVVLEPSALITLKAIKPEVFIGGLNFQLEKGGISSVDNSVSIEEYVVEDKTLSKEQFLALGAALSIPVGGVERVNTPDALLLAQKTKQDRKVFQFALGSVLGVLLFLAIVNYFMFSSYNEQLTLIDQKLFSTNASEERLNRLKKEVDEIQQLKIGINEVSLTEGAYIIDRLCSILPDEIRLSYISVESPNKIKDNHQIEFDSGQLKISGNTSSTLALNRWMENSSKVDGVKEVKLKSYEDSNESKGDFEINIELKSV